jgi:hypothetical protein
VAASIISESGNIGALYRYWLSLNNGAVPARDLIDPAAIKRLLPHIYLVAFETDPFRIHYRLSGTFADQWNGLSLAGRYLDEFLVNDAYGGNRLVHDSYERVWRTGEPVFGSYQWPTRSGYMTETRFGLLPLTQGGIVTQAISAEDFDMAPIGDSFMPFEDPLRQK